MRVAPHRHRRVRGIDIALGFGEPRLEPIELLDHLAEAVAECVGAQVHELAAQNANRAVERFGRRVGHEQMRDLLEHLTDQRHERARRQAPTAIELDRHFDGRARRHRVFDRVAADVERTDEPA